MNRIRARDFCVILIASLSLFLPLQMHAQNADIPYSVSFTEQELDTLLAPIALYPDPLLAQVLPAATYPREIEEAAAWLKQGGKPEDIDNQHWAESVKAVAHYPDVLNLMAENMDWTANLGDAFLNQPSEVTNSIQKLRSLARQMGNLVTNEKQQVVVEGEYIKIIPVQPQYIYVPYYNPTVVYVERPFYAPFITFGIGFPIGVWLHLDFDWPHHHVIYHGWSRPGWVNYARPYIHVTNVYINKSRPYIHQQWRHDPSHGNPARYLASRPSGPHASRYSRTGEVRGTIPQPRTVGPVFKPRGDAPTYSNRGRQSRGIVKAPIAPSPGIVQRPPVPTPRTKPPAIDSSGKRLSRDPSRASEPRMPTSGIRQPGITPRPFTPPRDVPDPRTQPSPGVRQKPQPKITPQPEGPKPDIAPRPMQPSPGVMKSVPATPRAPVTVQPPKTPSVTFGGYRGNQEARELSNRGQASRENAGTLRPFSGPREHSGGPSERGGARRNK
ncbi:MAG: DUF3300 domain-containing protein [Nitrospirota bacterium]